MTPSTRAGCVGRGRACRWFAGALTENGCGELAQSRHTPRPVLGARQFRRSTILEGPATPLGDPCPPGFSRGGCTAAGGFCVRVFDFGRFPMKLRPFQTVHPARHRPRHRHRCDLPAAWERQIVAGRLPADQDIGPGRRSVSPRDGVGPLRCQHRQARIVFSVARSEWSRGAVIASLIATLESGSSIRRRIPGYGCLARTAERRWVW